MISLETRNVLVTYRHEWYDSDMKGFHLANLSLPPNRILVGNGDLTPDKAEWVQPADMWTLIYYDHKNAVTQQSETTFVETGDVVIFAPSSRGAHGQTGPNTRFQFITFNLPGLTGSQEAVPRLIRGCQGSYDELWRATARITDSILPSIAYVWNFLWAHSQPRSRHRTQDALYIVESFIRENLSRKISMTELEQVGNLSGRHLLRLFRDQHNQTVQDYIRSLRVQESCRLLLVSDLSVKAIASKVGYTDLQEFNKLIRSATGVSPTKYRASTESVNPAVPGQKQ